MQDFISSNKIKENKYKILRMSLLLGSDDNREETINNFEDAARDIDAMNDEIYLKDLELKYYNTDNLEDEEKKLTNLVDYIGGRVEQRISLLTDFANVVGYDLTDLPPIKYYDKLDDYKERLKYIREYLSNTEEMDKINKELEIAESNLKNAYINKATSEESNIRSEETLLNKFKNTIKLVDELKDLDDDNIDNVLSEAILKTEESKKSLDIFSKSFMTLTNAGISSDEEKEYRSYVDNAKEIYYSNKEIEYLLSIYKLLLDKEQDYSRVIIKRDNINSILADRVNLRRDLNIEGNDILENIYDILDRQYEDISRQKNNIYNIEKLSQEISLKKNRLDELKVDNQKVEILALLREYGLIDTYVEVEKDIKSENAEEEKIPEVKLEDNNIDTNVDSVDDIVEEDKEDIFDVRNDVFNNDIEKVEEDSTVESNLEEDKKVQEEVKDNQVVSIDDAMDIDLDLIHSKANKVMRRVGEMLGISVEEEKIVNVSNDNNKDSAEVKEEEVKSDVVEVPENPLFNNNVEESTTVDNTKSENDTIEENNFWFSSDTPDALNELPDLDVAPNDNFFTNNDLGDLNFPDLNINFENNDTEAK